MKIYMVVFLRANESQLLVEAVLHILKSISKPKFKGEFGLSDSESCLIFAIEHSFDLNLVREISKNLGLDVSIGTLDEDEMEWMTSFDLAA